jgi:hypothetical protein
MMYATLGDARSASHAASFASDPAEPQSDDCDRHHSLGSRSSGVAERALHRLAARYAAPRSPLDPVFAPPMSKASPR